MFSKKLLKTVYKTYMLLNEQCCCIHSWDPTKDQQECQLKRDQCLFVLDEKLNYESNGGTGIQIIYLLFINLPYFPTINVNVWTIFQYFSRDKNNHECNCFWKCYFFTFSSHAIRDSFQSAIFSTCTRLLFFSSIKKAFYLSLSFYLSLFSFIKVVL